MGAKVSSFLHALYDPKKRQFLGRDGAGWGKLGVFYFFFYLGLAGFFCAMLAVFMALSPRDRPRYYSQSSRMRTRSNPLSPGLGFRPQPEVDKNIIFVKQTSDEPSLYAKSLDQYLKYYYPQQNPIEKQNKDGDSKSSYQTPNLDEYKFNINYPGNCTSAKQYGFTNGQPCVLVKMNKVVGFEPIPGAAPSERNVYAKTCDPKPKAIAVHCYGEYPADVDNIGPILYHSENGPSNKCGSLETKWFPYRGKQDRQDVYQAPYVWAQFLKPKTNVLINVLCRIYGENIDFDKKTGRALTRFQIFVDTTTKESSQGDL